MSTRAYLASGGEPSCRAWSLRLKQALESCGITCAAEAEVLAGCSSEQELTTRQLEALRQQLEDCDWCLLLVTPSAVLDMCRSSLLYASVGHGG